MTGEAKNAGVPAPLTVGELLRQYPQRTRITGWDPANPPEVERGFRIGYLIGASRCAEGDLEAAADLESRLHKRRGDIYHGESNIGFDRWSDRRAAVLRGAAQGVLDAVRARAEGVRKGIQPWLKGLRAWAAEQPVRLDWASACPPDPPEADGPPLGRDGVPKSLWAHVFGTCALLEPKPGEPARPRGPFIKSREQYQRYLRYAWEAVARLSASKDAAERRLIENLRAEAMRTQGEAPGAAAALAHIDRILSAPPLGNIERLLHPDPTVRNASAIQVPSPVLVRLSDVHPELVRWLWPGRIALGKLTLLAGDPGLGKSFVTLDLAARVSSGTAWPDLPLLPNPAGDVVLLSAEDDLSDTIRPRLDAAKADANRVVAIQAVRRVLITGQTQEEYFDLTQDLPALEAAIGQQPDCRLVVIDPLTAYLGKTDSHKNAEVRAVLAKLFELAARHKVAMLAVTHLNKASTMPAIYRAMGSLAFVAAARAVWAVVRDDEDETGRRRLFLPVKSNLSPDETGLAYALEPVGQTARVAWESGAVSVRADDALGGGRKAVVRDDATQFVIDTITANGGDILSDDLSSAAEAEGISERTLRRAKKAVTESYKEKGRGGRWRCKLKGGQEDGPDTHCPS
ncbi:MAG: AAA family ATPase [Planctomycetes bacterium]|nr:AAA family ATPase [Planctomycetota bacterium]